MVRCLLAYGDGWHHVAADWHHVAAEITRKVRLVMYGLYVRDASDPKRNLVWTASW